LVHTCEINFQEKPEVDETFEYLGNQLLNSFMQTFSLK